MFELVLYFAAIFLLPVTCFAVVTWAIMFAEGSSTLAALKHPRRTVRTENWIAAEAERGIHQLENHLALAAVVRKRDPRR